jgi:hypothetical protein
MIVKNQNISYPPSVVPPSPNEFPNSVRLITGITRQDVATVTIPNHGFTESADVGDIPGIGITTLSFHYVQGMYQINTLTGMILKVIDVDNIIVSIDTSTFSPYSSGGQALIVGGHAPYSPFENIL